MADAHSLLSQNRWHGVDLTELVHHQLAPYATDTNTTIRGPNVTLTVAETQGLAMVLHELVTNAAKYGALSTGNGRVEVIWNRGPGEDAGIIGRARPGALEERDRLAGEVVEEAVIGGAGA